MGMWLGTKYQRTITVEGVCVCVCLCNKYDLAVWQLLRASVSGYADCALHGDTWLRDENGQRTSQNSACQAG